MRRVKLDRGDQRLAVVCLLAVAIGAVVFLKGFSRAFPEASIDFEVNREKAVETARAALVARGFDVSGHRALVAFEVDDEAKVFLERTLGLSRANELFSRTVPIWRWTVRFVKPERKLEYRVPVSPGGELLAFRRVVPEGDAAPDPGLAAARGLAEETLRSMRGLDPGALRFIEAHEEKRPARVDRTFVWESRAIRFGEAALRYLVEVQGDRVGRSSLHLEVPESWRREYQTLRSKNQAAGAVATFGLFATAVALLVTFFSRVRRGDVKWRLALAFGGTGAGLQLLASLNELPVALFGYDTNDTWAGFLSKALLGDLGLALTQGVVVFLLVAGGEPLYREAYGDKPALGRIFSRGGIRSRSFFRGLLLGYALAALFFAYQIVFYIVTDRFGAWAPAEVPYSDLLGTKFPWLAVLLMGFMPATTEEFLSRMFSIPFAGRFLPRWAAILVPAMIWGFAHSAYPNQPFFIRGLEVSLAGVVIGLVMLRAGILPLLVWHFTVDAVYTALILLRSSSTYFRISGGVAAFALVFPLLVTIVLYLVEGGFLPDELIRNASVGTAPPPPFTAEPERPAAPPPRPLRLPLVLAGLSLALAVLFVSRVALPRASIEGERKITLDRVGARRLADAFVNRSSDDAAAYPTVRTLDSALPALEGADESGADLIPYDWSGHGEAWLLAHGGVPRVARVAAPVWQVRYFRPLDRHGFRVSLDARDGRIVGFKRTFPKEEEGASLGSDGALALALQVIAERAPGEPPGTLVASKAEEAPKRRDHRLVFESANEGVLTRTVVEIAGDRPALYATALKLPEKWVEERRRWTTVLYVSIAWLVAGIGVSVGLLIVTLIRIVRRLELPWRHLLRLAGLATVPTLARDLVSLPSMLKGYPDPPAFGLGAFVTTAAVDVTRGLALRFLMALLVFALVAAARPAALGAPRCTDPKRSLAAAVLAALLVFSVRLLGSNLAAAWPLAMGVGGFPEPPGVESLVPAIVVLDDAVSLALLAAGAVALLKVLSEDFLSSNGKRIVTALLFVGILVPLGPRTLSEMLVPLLARTLVLAAFLAALECFLGDDTPAFGLTIVLYSLGRSGAALLVSGVSFWQWNGVAVFAVGLAAAVALLIPRRDASAA